MNHPLDQISTSNTTRTFKHLFYKYGGKRSGCVGCIGHAEERFGTKRKGRPDLVDKLRRCSGYRDYVHEVGFVLEVRGPPVGVKKA